MKKWNNLKFSHKVILLSVIGSLLSVLGFFVLYLPEFEANKKGYIIEAIASQSHSTSNQIQADMSLVKNRANFFLRGYNWKQHQFHPYSKSTFHQEKNLNAIWVFKWQPELEKYTFVSELKKNDIDMDQNMKLIPILIKESLEAGHSLRWPDQESSQWLFAFTKKVNQEAHPMVFINALEESHFAEHFYNQKTQNTYLINHHGQIIASPKKTLFNLSKKEVQKAIHKILKKSKSAPELKTIQSINGEKTLLMAGSLVSPANDYVISIVPEDQVGIGLVASHPKFLLVLALVAFFSILVSILLSSPLQKAMSELKQACTAISEGEINVYWNGEQSPETRSAAISFNRAIQKVREQMGLTPPSLTDPNEFSEESSTDPFPETTSSVVQESVGFVTNENFEIQSSLEEKTLAFLPNNYFSDTDVEIAGQRMTSSEDCGDWWFYLKSESKVFVFIGDTAGRSALNLTAMAHIRSSCELLQQQPDWPITQFVSFLNDSLHIATQGEVKMTLFAGCFDKATQVFSYTNASHHPPLLIPGSQQAIEKSDLVPLAGNQGATLGERQNSNYKESQFKMQPGDRIIFYTKGVTELQNPQGEIWGERRFLQTIMETKNDLEFSDLPLASKKLEFEMNRFKQNQNPKEDATYVFLQMPKAG